MKGESRMNINLKYAFMFTLLFAWLFVSLNSCNDYGTSSTVDEKITFIDAPVKGYNSKASPYIRHHVYKREDNSTMLAFIPEFADSFDIISVKYEYGVVYITLDVSGELYKTGDVIDVKFVDMSLPPPPPEQ